MGKEHVRSISMYGCSSMVSCASFTKWCLLAWSELYILHLMACVRAFPPYTFFTSLPCRWLMVILEFLFCGPSDSDKKDLYRFQNSICFLYCTTVFIELYNLDYCVHEWIYKIESSLLCFIMQKFYLLALCKS